MTIREWLNNPSDFNTGRQLYDKYGKNGHLKKQFAAGRLREKMIYELGKLVGVDDHHSNELIIVANGISNEVIPTKLEILEEEEDPRLKVLYQERSVLHSQLMYMKKEERQDAALKIESLTDDIEDILLPAKKAIAKVEGNIAILSDLDKLKRIQTLKTYISRAEKRQTDPEKVTGWKEEKERLERELNEEA